VGATALATSVAISFSQNVAASELVAWAGAAQPPFSLPAIEGGTVALGGQHGDALLVHFFATWCEPCRDELPALTRLSERGGSSVRVLTIAVAEPEARIRRFVQTLPIKLPVLLDRDRAVAKAWHVATLPTTFVLDAQLQARLVVESDYAWDSVDPQTLVDIISANGGPNPQQTLREDSHNAIR